MRDKSSAAAFHPPLWHWGVVVAWLLASFIALMPGTGDVPALVIRVIFLGLILSSLYRPYLLCIDMMLAYLAVRLSLYVYFMSLGGWTWVGGIAAAVSAAFAWYLWQQRKELTAEAVDEADEDDEAGPLSIVALLTELPYIDGGVVRRAAGTAWGMEESATAEEVEDDAEEFVLGDPPLMFAQHLGARYLIHAHSQPYFDNAEEAAEPVSDVRVYRAMTEHGAWIAVDAMLDDLEDTAAVNAAYGKIGKLLSELIDESCLGLLFPQLGEAYPFDPEMLLGLKSGDPRGSESVLAPSTGDGDARRRADAIGGGGSAASLARVR
ncbi:MAG: hypothetical protein R3B90_20630 [Planctomycetaceae bacterium]